MPFTFSHPAIVLPFSKSKWLRVSLTGLIAGSMVPDMEFLFRLQETNNFAHNWPWVLVFNVPFALLLAYLYHYLIRDNLIFHAPKWFRQRLVPFTNFNWNRFFKANVIRVIISVAVGIASHIFLDSITHKNGAITKLSGFFYYNLYAGQFKLTVYDSLQWGGSVIGAWYILYYISRLEKVTVANPSTAAAYWLSAIVCFTLILLVRLFVYFYGQSLEDVIIAVVGSMVYSIIAASIYIRWVQKKSLRV